MIATPVFFETCSVGGGSLSQDGGEREGEAPVALDSTLVFCEGEEQGFFFFLSLIGLGLGLGARVRRVLVGNDGPSLRLGFFSPPPSKLVASQSTYRGVIQKVCFATALTNCNDMQIK
jgi:hypothetical protein